MMISPESAWSGQGYNLSHSKQRSAALPQACAGTRYLSGLAYLVVRSEAGRSRVGSGFQGLPDHRGPRTSRSQCCRDTAVAGSGPAHRTAGCGAGQQDECAGPGHRAAGAHRVSVQRWGLPGPEQRRYKGGVKGIATHPLLPASLKVSRGFLFFYNWKTG